MYDFYRCLTRSQLLQYNCSEGEIYENQPALDVLLDKPLKDYETRDDQAVQVTPQRAYLKLVKGVCVALFSYFYTNGVILSNVCHRGALPPLSPSLRLLVLFFFSIKCVTLRLLPSPSSCVCFADLFHIIFEHFVLCPRFAYQHFVVVTSSSHCYCIWRGNTSYPIRFLLSFSLFFSMWECIEPTW